jgi:hypothetical protein
LSIFLNSRFYEGIAEAKFRDELTKEVKLKMSAAGTKPFIHFLTTFPPVKKTSTHSDKTSS